MNYLPLALPWHFSPTVVVATVVAGGLYARGCRKDPMPWARQVSFWVGLILMYVALHTRVDYYAEREFFVHRLQHLVLHHLAPFFLALAWPSRALWAGIPTGWRIRYVSPFLNAKPVRLFVRGFTNPIITGVLFVGLIWLWLIPTVHFYAMLDLRLYKLMNWSMALDGVVFWVLVLDPRAQPPARLSPGVRVMLQAAVMPPEMASGAIVTFAGRNLYPLYELCGRAFSTISAHTDQTIGGLILWIPSSMMSLVGVLIAMYAWFKLAEKEPTPTPAAVPPVSPLLER